MGDLTTIATRVINRIPPTFSALERAAFVMQAPDTPETLRDIARREVARAHQARREHESRSGVRWSGLDDDPYHVRPVEAMLAEAETHETFLTSPRGRFLTAVFEIAHVPDCAPAAEKLLALYRRDLADDRHPASPRAVGAALTILNGVHTKAARDAVDALAELLLEQRPA
jgi:hypothetical protein